MSEWRLAAFGAALRAVEGGPPKNLIARAQPEAADRGETLTSEDLTDALKTIEGTNPFLSSLGMQVHKWDVQPATEEWADDTEPSTPARRDTICTLLGLDTAGAAQLLEMRPIFSDGNVVITAPWERWYTPELAEQRSFYWKRYLDYLLTVKLWDEDSITSLDVASTQVLERLSDPTRPEANQAKGLVVGYVQSGKTANFTGVVAKAIDAGYRLVVVMTGTIEMLRAQTQRRIDMEMVGRQNILGDLSAELAAEQGIDYQDDRDWLNGRFLDLEEQNLATEIRRLTVHHKDYQKQFRTLKIERFEAGRPLYDPDNLFRTDARLAIVKKNGTVLKKLVDDIKANKSAFAEIPVLIIDDESDQASVNTVDPEKVIKAKAEGKEIKERRAINERIAAMLELMPRAQYVGYTATPFANVFVDPADPQGIFPKDFVIGLDRPAGYMGVEDFHDLSELDEDAPSAVGPNEKARVRSLRAGEDDESAQDTELATAIDMFVLTGAVKLFRAAADPQQVFRHHTMLVHHSVKKADHSELADRVRSLWTQAEFARPAGKSRLKVLYESDILPVSAEQGLAPGLVPSFEQLTEFIPRAIGRITEHDHNPVIVVNSDKDIQQNQQSLDFDRYDTWRILVGGAKLSRGFTVEGLTVTYFRRATNMGDSLTQMGRWFGFRQGYRDLVRLYIARKARFGKKTVDLYQAFENIAIDEAAFREQLKKYAEWDGDAPKILPRQIPPLVEQHLPWLRPTARNKMFNAVLTEQIEQPFTPSGYSNTLVGLKANLDLWRPILKIADQEAELPEGTGTSTFDAFTGRIDASPLLEAIERTEFLDLYKERSVIPRLNFLQRLLDQDDLDDFAVIVPQLETSTVAITGVGERAVVSRDRRPGRGNKFGEMTSKRNRVAAERFVDGEPPEALQSLHSAKTGAVVIYLAREKRPHHDKSPSKTPSATDVETGLVVAFSVYAPQACIRANPAVPTWTVHDQSQEDSVTIEVPGAAE